MKRIRQLVAFFLLAVLLLSVLPVGALAAEDDAASPSVSQAEETQPADDTSDESTPTEEIEGTEETEASVPEDGTADSEDFSQSRFLEEYAAAASYTLDQSLVLTSGLTLDHEIRIPAGGEILVPDNVTLTVSGKLTIDGGTVKVLSGGELVLESGGAIEVLRGLLSVSAGGSFVNRAGADAISVSQGSGTVEGIGLEETETSNETEAAEDDVENVPVLLSANGNGIQAKIDLIRTVYPHGSYFTKSGTAHPISDLNVCPYDPNNYPMPYSTCECSLSQITKKVSGLLSGQEVYQIINANRWQCFAFATYVFYNIFGHDYTECNTVPLSEAKLGDFVRFNFSGGSQHFGIFLYATSSNVVVYDANSDSGTTCMVRYESYQTNDSSVVTVFRAPNYDEVNGTASYHLDLNGFLDGKSADNILGYGTADIYIKDALYKSNTYDFYEELPIGTKYEIKNIQAAPGYKYNGVYSGSLSGTISNGDVAVVLSFSTLPACKITYKNSSGDAVKTVSQGGYTIAEDYEKQDGSYFMGWSYKANANMFDVRPGETIQVTEDITLYPVYISHEDAISGEPVLIYNISDFPADGYSITETAKEVSTSAGTRTYTAYIILPETIDTITVSYNANGGTGAPGSQVFAVVPDGWTSQRIPGQEILETKTQYRSREKTFQSSAEKNLTGWTLISSEVSGYGDWSDWTATPITADENTEVRTQEVPATYKTVWHYSRDTANGYSTYAIGYYGNPEYITLDYPLTAKGTVDGHTHYGSYGTTLVNYWWNEESETVVDQAAYTAYSSRRVYHVYRYYKWSDWTEYTDTPATASDTVEVQTRTMYRYAAGVKISDTVPVCSGYTFLGWAATASATTAAYQPGELFVPSADTTLYAVWKKVTYTVSYNANGGTGAPASQTKTHGTALTLSSAKPTRTSTSAGSYTVTLNGNSGTVTPGTLTVARTTNYTFKNWNTAANGSGTVYASGASYTADAAVTLYAQWNSSTATASVTLPTPTRTGWTFQNWNTKADGTGTAYGAKASYTPSGNVTLYAIWQQDQETVGTLSLGTASGSEGSEVVLDVKLDKNPGIMALNFFFDYDKSKLEFLGGEEGTLTGWTFSTTGNGALWDSDGDCTNTGTIARLRFKILDDVDEGDVPIVLRDILAGNYADQEIYFAAVSGNVTIRNRIPGDMTGDGKVNVMDLIRLRKYLAGDSVEINLSNADVTGDGKVNVMDLIRLRKYLAGDDVDLI